MLHARLISTALHLSASRGVVHSVFAHAANIRVADQLIGIVPPEAGALPNGLTLRDCVDFLSLGVAPGQSILTTPCTWHIPSINLSINLAPAVRWSPVLTARGVPRPIHDVRPHLPPLPAYTERARASMAALVEAIRS